MSSAPSRPRRPTVPAVGGRRPRPRGARRPGLDAQPARVRARDLGIVIGTLPTGPANAITDVDGVLVGHATIVRGEGALKVGEGPVRTGVTAVLPRQDIWYTSVFAATYTLNGDGEMTGTHWIRDLETLAHPLLITNTGSIGAVHDAAIAYMTERHPKRDWGFLPVVAETWDGTLERRARPARPEGAGLRGARRRPRRPGGRGQRRRRHRHDLLPLQVRHRHLVAEAAGRRRRLHRRRAGAGQLRRPRPAAHRRRAGGPRDSRGDARHQVECRHRRGPRGIGDRRRRHRRAAVVASAGADGPAGVARPGPHRHRVGQHQRRHHPGVLDRQRHPDERDRRG